jgi:uncharacterized protein
LVPFAAVKGFLDPHVQFGLQFEVKMEEEEAVHTDTAAIKPIKGKLQKDETGATSATPEEAQAEKDGEAPDDAATKVVSLDAFRKK